MWSQRRADRPQNRAKKMVCVDGHIISASNPRNEKSECRLCRREQSRRYYASKREALGMTVNPYGPRIPVDLALIAEDPELEAEMDRKAVLWLQSAGLR